MKMRKVVVFLGILLMACLLGRRGDTPSVRAAASDYLQKVESSVLSSTTKKIQYRYGKTTSKQKKIWKNAAKLSLSAKNLTISKKGWYTFRITKTSGKYKLFQLKLKKKTYQIRANTPLKKNAGTYFLVSKSKETQGLQIRNSALTEGADVLLGTKTALASCVWQLESAGGTKFRLKNVNSGLYLGSGANGSTTKMVQKKFDKSDKDLVFQCMFAGGSYVYLKNIKTKKYLYIDGNNIYSGSRQKKTEWKFRFVSAVLPEGTVSVSSDVTYPVSLVFGSAFSLKGTITSNYTMVSVTASVVDESGKEVLSQRAAPNTTSYNLKGLDAGIPFGKLPIGKYQYKITVVDSAGHTVTALDKSFTVYLPTASATGTLLYNSALIATIGHQSNGTALEKKACASYALAYCNAILYGTTPSPHSYWVSETNVDCDWSKGGYTTSAYSSEREVLLAAYGQLVAGKPCILHVTGSSGNQHWVTLVGYQNLINTSVLSASNFVALDPWDGSLITVSDKYTVRTTYRLGYKAS
jgi:hypothetical protein